MAETVRTADSSGVSPATKAETEDPTPKSKSAKVSGSSVKPPKLNERGVPVTNWDNVAKPPSERASIADDPEGKSNAK